MRREPHDAAVDMRTDSWREHHGVIDDSAAATAANPHVQNTDMSLCMGCSDMSERISKHFAILCDKE